MWIGWGNEYADFHADLIAVYILNPDELKKHGELPHLKETLQTISEIFSQEDFKTLRDKIEHATSKYQSEVENRVETGEIENPTWLRDKNSNKTPYAAERVFDKIKEYYKITNENDSL